MDPRRSIPSVDRVLGDDAFAPLRARASRERLRRALDGVQRALRASLEHEAPPEGFESPEWYVGPVQARLDEEDAPSLRRVINATGVVLHTNLGRAPLAERARAALIRDMAGYMNLEYDLAAGVRGSRYTHCVGLLRELTGAEDALVVNNNAAGVVLALNTLARDTRVVVSRGELVEIGGSFRIPEIMERSGARMVEVGATNRTHESDYVAALESGAGAVLKVHRSNFRVSGFTADVDTATLARLAHDAHVPLIEDLGSGLLVAPELLGLPPEPTAGQVLEAGADLVTLSGDKLLGGPQAGIIVGRGDLVARLRRNPLCRALRVDKLTLSALEATLSLYREPERALREIPALRMLAATAASLAGRADALAGRLREGGVAAVTRDGASTVGGGAYPDVDLPTTLVVIDVETPGAQALLAALRAADPPVVARIVDDRVVLDPRTVAEDEESALVTAVLGTLERV